MEIFIIFDEQTGHEPFMFVPLYPRARGNFIKRGLWTRGDF